ncbi:MAG: TRAP transporter small permease subunit [Deltaproteobacteria bacterium]|nr:TRAP transporter small permease subunit [Deltaproteobacteria bacterium]MBW2017837.1 TRAP transporter small permease subunit [Deltaproteobacteria bacterium]MBW2129050.1 TRAP transporter small permease subunit [Deltaproteobacteria bacterium]MBW2303049.1 TRAP transporter small permease subunit [Deltaproteobacteria bacterium]
MTLKQITSIIDRFNEGVGNVICWGIFIVMVFQVADVILRVVFNSPQIWVWDVNGQLMISFAILGGGYVYLHEGHVRMDLIYAKLTPKKRLMAELICFPVFLFLMVLIIWQGGRMAWHSWSILERGRNLIWKPPLYFVKSMLFLGGIFLLLQGISNFVKRVEEARESEDNGEDQPET